jgi:hypothetical protein
VNREKKVLMKVVIGISTFEILEFLRSRKSGHFKFQNSESGSELSVCGDAWQRRSVVGILEHQISTFRES